MNFRRISAATAGLMLAGIIAPGTATAASATGTQRDAAAACSTWIDYAYGRGRAHANCQGMGIDVSVYVKCGNGRSYASSPYWRWEYNKAECPSGIGATGMSYDVR
ncbi:hypothetical protein [Streptomyces griseocarneus]|uniref:hypothetical protein n=1 Tax=Streptomyces griseocarneus TaxID=51201 RepID=UPI00167ED2A6|nr:hypothetical protein [Streptomyces griseocarneus]MBZ6476660.1 hypothetical protein [Streptomyces griseocarneus]GHG80176.1 hypothetical protein GCM10018779_61530 [Streptomyces griseocarneus]